MAKKNDDEMTPEELKPYLEAEEEDDGEGDDSYDDDEEDEDEEASLTKYKNSKPTITHEHAKIFDKALSQIASFYSELGKISAKKPDGPVNKFKLGLLNQTIVNANVLLQGDYLPFSTFEKFDEAAMTSASDVVTVLAQYLLSMRKFRGAHARYTLGNWYWNYPTDDVGSESEGEEDEE